MSWIGSENFGTLTPAPELCQRGSESTCVPLIARTRVRFFSERKAIDYLAANADVSKGGATCDPDLGLHQVHPCDLLRACVLHLHASITCFNPPCMPTTSITSINPLVALGCKQSHTFTSHHQHNRCKCIECRTQF